MRTFLTLFLRLFAITALIGASVGGAGVGSVTSAAATPQTPAGLTCQALPASPSAAVDAYIKQEKQDERRGGDSELRVKTENGKLMRSLLKFDLASIPSTAIISSATLSLYVKGASGGSVTINAHKITAAWNEAEVTWKARDKAAGLLWTSLGGDYNATVAASAAVDDTKDVWRSWNLTSLASGWLATPASNYGVILEAPVTNPKTEKIFKSSDDGTASQRPKLEVCYSAAVSLEPDNSGEGVAGQTRTYVHALHVGNLTTVVNLSAASSQGWPTRIYKDVDGDGVKDPEDTLISQTPAIGPNADYHILVQVSVPGGAAQGVADTTTVTATAVSTGASDTATDTTRVGQLIALLPDQNQYATAGSGVFYRHTLTNNGQAADCFTVSAASSQGWITLLWQDSRTGTGVYTNPLVNPVCVAPGATAYLAVEVRVAAAAPAKTVERTVVTARSGNDPSKSDSATDTTVVFVNDPPVIDGKYDDAYRISPYANEVCYTSNGTLFGKLASFYQPTSNAVYMVLAIDKDFVDNTYGTNIVNWNRAHNFSDLVGSDHAQFLGYNANGVLVLDIKQDYITAASGTPSGYDSLGVTGGEGRVNTGSAAHILQWATSEDYNLNNTGYCSGGNCAGAGTDLKVNSPATDSFYTPNSTYPNWIYDVIYELKIDKAAFGATGFGSLDVPYIHASPSKLGTNTIYAEPGVCPGEIGDFVWYDTNHDGIQDSGEAGISGVQVKLYRDNGDGLFSTASDALVGTKTTTSGGKYLFEDLTPDDYFVDVVDATVPSGYVITTHNDPTSVINLGEGQRYLLADFGYVRPYPDLEVVKTLTSSPPVYVGQEISFTIRVTNTGLTTITTLPLQDWFDPTTLEFLGATPAPSANGSGTLTWADLTTSLGDLAPGQAVVVVTRFRALQATTAASLAAAAGAVLMTGAPDLVSPSWSIEVWPAATCSGWQILFQRAHGTASENWRAKVDGTIIATGTTYGNNETVTGTWPAWVDLTKSHTFLAEIYENGSWLGRSATFGNCPAPATGSIGDRVFYDLNGSGLPDGGAEPGINGVTVRLFSNACTGTPLATATTAGNGGYSFTSLAAGTYCVNVDPSSVPAGHQLTTGNLPLTVSLAIGQNYTTADFGYRVQCPTGTPNLALVKGAVDATGVVLGDYQSYACVTIEQPGGAIGDLVWNDANGNGVRDYYTPTVGTPQLEPGIEGAVVALTLPGGSVITRTTTITGYYQFTGLGPGQYAVDVIQVPAGYFPTTTNHPQTVNLTSGQSFQDADFGYAGKGLISGVVFYDWSHDGIQDLNEGPVPNTEVCLYKDNNRDGLLDGGDTQLTCMPTDSMGIYAFAGQIAGAYLVVETQPAGLQNTTPNVLPVALVIVGPGGSAPDNNFGEIVYVRLGDMVYVDLNGNGVQDAGETIGLAEVSLQLTGTNIAGESVNWTTVTITNGHYLTDTLLPGAYTVKAPAQFGGFQLTSQASKTTALTTVITQDLTLDFGYIFPTGVGVYEFKAAAGRGQVTLSWLAFGPQPPSFHVQRADNSKGVGAVQVTAQPVTSGTGAYQFVDRGVVAGQIYWYTLEEANSGQTYGPLVVAVAPMSIRAFLPMMGQ